MRVQCPGAIVFLSLICRGSIVLMQWRSWCYRKRGIRPAHQRGQSAFGVRFFAGDAEACFPSTAAAVGGEFVDAPPCPPTPIIKTGRKQQNTKITTAPPKIKRPFWGGMEMVPFET